MALQFMDGFDQYQGQTGATLLSSLLGADYSVSSDLAVAAGRKDGTYSLELQVSSGPAGESWSSRSTNLKQDLHGIDCNSSGRFVAVGDNGAAVYSDDNITWVPVVLGVSVGMKAIKNQGSTWVAVGDSGTILRSTDGRHWVSRSSPISTANFKDVAYGNDAWVAVGSTGSNGVIVVSTDDGLNWTQVTVSNLHAVNCVEYGDAWIIGSTNGEVLVSGDGASWASQSLGTTSNVADLAYDGATGHWLACAGANIYRSVNGGTAWSVAASSVISGTLTSIVQANSRWIAIGTNAQIRMSDDETTWTTPALTGAGTSTLYCVATSRSSRAGYVLAGAMNTAQGSSQRSPVLYVSLAPPTKVTRTAKTEASKLVIGFAHQSTARGRILSIKNVLDMDWPGAITIGGETGTAIPARNVTYYYELTIDRDNRLVTLHINNTLDITAPLPSSVSTQTEFEITWIAENGAVTRLDDLYLLDSSSFNDEQLVSRLGPIQIPIRMPTADVMKAWTTSSGSQHWAVVGFLPPSAESYIRSAVSGSQDLFSSDTALPSGAGTSSAPILAVGIMALAQKGDIDNRQLGLVVGQGPTQKEFVDTTLSIVPEYSLGIFETAPGDVAWDADNILTTPFGVVVRP